MTGRLVPSTARVRRTAAVLAVLTAVVGVVGVAPAAAGTYVVRPGDTLSSVARRLGVPVATLAAANGVRDPDRVLAGTRLRVPPRTAETGTGRGLPHRLRARPERLALLPRFDHWAAAYRVPPDLLKAMTWLESGWQNHKVSLTGARGIGQLMPDTVQFVAGVLLRLPLDPRRPDDNIRMSARFLRYLLDSSGWRVSPALAAYYQGLRSIRQQGLQPVTQQYVQAVVALRPRFRITRL